MQPSDSMPDVPPAPRQLPQPEDFPESGPNALGAVGSRAGARLLDLLIAAAPLVLVYIAAVTVAARDSGAAPEDAVPPAWALALALAFAVGYETISLALGGATLFMRVFGLRVARYTDGRRPTWEQAFLRTLVPWTAVALVLPWVGLVGIGGAFGAAGVVYLTSLYNPLRRGVHDIAGGTIVIRTR